MSGDPQVLSCDNVDDGSPQIHMIKTPSLADHSSLLPHTPPQTLRLYPPTDPATTLVSTESVSLPVIHGSICEILTDAFHDNSVLRTMLHPIRDDPELCTAFRRFIYERRLGLWHEHSWTILATEPASNQRNVIGHIMIQPPGANNMALGLVKLITMGFLKLPFLFGMQVAMRTQAVLSKFKEVQDEVLSAHNEAVAGGMMIVEAFAMAPKTQGKGIGGRVMGAVMQSLVDKAGGLPVFLMTQEESNVRFYERHGFRVLDRRRVEIGDGDGDGFGNWIMLRPAARSNDSVSEQKN